MSIDSTVTRRMTMANDVSQEKKFVPSVLPWVLAGAALLVYLVSLNRWMRLGSVGNVAMVSGWIWQPELSRPLYWLVTAPLRLLPASLIPVALNFFSALCAAATLGLLARSVALLPQDRTEDQRLREKSAFSLLSIRHAWLPPVLAVLICGLQLTFWENATAASSDILDLLLFAYVVRCILEFRLYGADSWLLRACLVYGAAMTNNWAMIALLPVFLVALAWAKGLGFFNLRFLFQALALGSLGLCFYVLLPVAALASTGGQLGFWEALKSHLVEQKYYLGAIFNKGVLFMGDRPWWVLALPSLLPVLAISFRWPSYFGDPSKLGVALATFAFHFLHAALLAVCLWVSLDPIFSPRNYAGLQALPLYYLGALSVGYLAGYFLLIFGGAKPMLRSRPLPGYPAALNALVTLAVWVLLLLLPGALLYRNLPQIRFTNGQALRQYVQLTAQDIPAANSVVLSDDPLRLMLLRSLWTQRHERQPALLLETRSLAMPFYHQFLAKQFPNRLKAQADRKVPYDDAQILGLVKALASTNSLYYLHPSFGYYFEPFFAEPHRLVYRLQSYPTNMLIKPPLTAELVDQNQKFWSEMSQGVLKQVRTVAELGAQKTKEGPLDRFFRPLLERVHVTRLGNPDALWLAHISSRALNSLGVDLQRQGMYPEAGAHFLDAKELFTNNVAAAINLEFNRALKDNNAPLQQAKRTDEQLGGYRRIQDMMNDNGPVDEPRYCYALGREFFLGNNHRQAAQEFNRVAQLAPEGSADNLSSRLLLARSAMLVGMPDEGLKVINDLHARAAALGLSETNAPDLLQLETIAYFFKSDTNAAIKAIDTTLAAYPTNVSLLDIATTLLVQAGLTNSARKLVETAWTTYPRDVQLLNTVVQGYLGTGMTNTAIQLIDAALTANPGNEAWLAAGTKLYLQAGCYPKALATAEQQLKTRPDNVSASFAKGVACLKLNDFTNSAAAFTTLVRLGTNDFPDLYYPALINRGFAFWKSGKLDEARRDYESLRQSFPNAPQFSYSLGEIAYTKKDTKAAIRNYELFLSRAPTNTAEASNVLARLKELRGGSR